MNLPNSWKNYLSSLSSADERNRHLTDVRDLLRHGKSPDQAVTDMVNDPDAVILYRAPDDNMKILFQHNQFTGSWLEADRSSIFVSHSGAGAQAGLYEVDRATLFQDVTLNAPTATSLRNTNSAEALLALQAPAQNPTVFHGKRSIVLPPFLIEAYYGADDRSPAGLFETFQQAVIDFDNANAGASASADCAYVRQFLWACAHSFIEPVTREDSERPAAVQWSEGLHSRLIASTAPVLPVDGDVARGLLEAQQQTLELMQSQQTVEQERALEKERKANKTSKLSSHALSVLKFIQVKDGDVTPSEVAPAMDRLLNQPSTAQARTFVQQELRKRGISTTVNQGLASALFTGNLIWDYRSIPNQLTFFALTRHAGFDTSSSSTSTELWLSAFGLQAKGGLYSSPPSLTIIPFSCYSPVYQNTLRRLNRLCSKVLRTHTPTSNPTCSRVLRNLVDMCQIK